MSFKCSWICSRNFSQAYFSNVTSFFLDFFFQCYWPHWNLNVSSWEQPGKKNNWGVGIQNSRFSSSGFPWGSWKLKKSHWFWPGRQITLRSHMQLEGVQQAFGFQNNVNLTQADTHILKTWGVKKEVFPQLTLVIPTPIRHSPFHFGPNGFLISDPHILDCLHLYISFTHWMYRKLRKVTWCKDLVCAHSDKFVLFCPQQFFCALESAEKPEEQAHFSLDHWLVWHVHSS